MSTCLEVLKVVMSKKMAAEECLDETDATDATLEDEIQEHLKSCERCRVLVESINKGNIQGGSTCC